MSTIGVDVSKYQGVIDWVKVKAAGYRFAMIRQGWINSDGSITEDPFYRQNMTNAQAAGVHTGVYLYCYATATSAMEKAAENCINRLKGFVCDMPVALDFEDSAIYGGMTVAQNTALCKAFLDRVEDYGFYGILYTYKSFAQNYLDMGKLAAYDFWLAHYTSKTNYAGAYGMWQHTSSGAVNGINGRVDLNIAYKDYPSIIKKAGLNNLAIKKPKMYTVTTGKMSAGDKAAICKKLDGLKIGYDVREV